MKIALVGATGNVGGPLSRSLLAAGHQVRALTRGGKASDELERLGAEIYNGTFEDASSEVSTFFDGADAAYTMVKTDWTEANHYATVADRIVAGVRGSSVNRVVNLSAMGADLSTGAGHSSDFYKLESALDALPSAQVIHLRCGWFMENFCRIADGVAKYGRVAGMMPPHVKLPCIAACDIPAVAERTLLDPPPEHRVIVEVQGSEDLTMFDVVDQIARKIGRRVDYIHIATDDEDAKAMFLKDFGTPEVWQHRVEMYDAFALGHARFHEPRSARNSTSTTFDRFLDQTWMPIYKAALAKKDSLPETFESYLMARHSGR